MSEKTYEERDISLILAFEFSLNESYLCVYWGKKIIEINRNLVLKINDRI